MQTPCLSSLFSERRPSSRMGMISGRIFSPSFLTKSPRVRAAIWPMTNLGLFEHLCTLDEFMKFETKTYHCILFKTWKVHKYKSLGMCVYRSLIREGRGQEAQQQGEECRQNFSECTWSVGHHNLPDMQGGLSNHKLCVWAAHIEARKHTVPSFNSQCANNGLRSTINILLSIK